MVIEFLEEARLEVGGKEKINNFFIRFSLGIQILKMQYFNDNLLYSFLTSGFLPYMAICSYINKYRGQDAMLNKGRCKL